MPSLNGIFPPIPTPFDRDGRVSIPHLKENLSAWNRYQLSGYVVLGSNGEAPLIREKEKLALLEAAREGIPEDRTMIAGTGCQSTGATIRLTKDAAELGADFALVLPPYYYKAQMKGDVLERHYKAIADSSPIPILIYNIPATTGIDIPAETVGRLAEHENIVGMKDSSGSLVKFAEIRRSTPRSSSSPAQRASSSPRSPSVDPAGSSPLPTSPPLTRSSSSAYSKRGESMKRALFSSRSFRRTMQSPTGSGFRRSRRHSTCSGCTAMTSGRSSAES